ncbi:hypothetical protein B4U80_10290 [Leptotrombidium deliense]|uniref:Tyrosine--tRNA ligase n=1 Tax=Leptotrombidium deliense TaxID=299467 RepID=A0A443SQB1_9ACAR|nr:hypothetical protein B4U80_10290 [Leptotrombidium deliense]
MWRQRVNFRLLNSLLTCSTNHFNCCRLLSGKFVHKLKERGLITSHFPDKDDVHFIISKPQTFYAGFDPTSDSLHIGNLLVLMNLLHCAREGHRVICVIGDASARVGDPSDKLKERPFLDKSIAVQNASNISSDINKIFSNHYKYFWKNTEHSKQSIADPLIISNENWYDSKNLIDFLVNIGRHISVNQMLTRTYIKMRINEEKRIPLSEFFYQAIQAYDWFYLFHKYGCRFQIGGNDQQGNIFTGYELIRKLSKDKERIPCYGLLIPLLTEETGGKISKSSSSVDVVWLNRKKMSSFSFYQYFINLPDVKLETYLKLFTFYTKDEIDSILRKHFKLPDSRHAQKKIAETVTLLVHGEEGLREAQTTTKALFESDIISFGKLNDRTLDEIFGSDLLTTMFLEPEETSIVDVMVKATKCNEMDAVKLVEQGAVRLNVKKITSAGHLINDEDILENRTTLMTIGKRRKYVIKWA